MYVEKETEKAFLMCKDAVSFWIQKRWLVKAGGELSLTKDGWKAYHIAAREHWKHFGYDALKEFAVVRETEKAALLRCAVELPDGTEKGAEFWIPKARACDWSYVRKKVVGIEAGFPFHGTRVRWSGMNEGKRPRGGRGSAKAAVVPPSTPEGSGGFL
jgi:hypothetical protein